MFEAYITNAALYPEAGVEVGTTLKFPATTQEVQAALAKIGIDGKQYTEVFFTSFDSDDVLGCMIISMNTRALTSSTSWRTPCLEYGIRASWKSTKPLLS